MNSKGMTLIELLVALAIFSLMVTAGYVGLDQGLFYEQRLQSKREYWQQLDSAYAMLQQDFAQAAERISMHTGLAFTGRGASETGSALVEFNRGRPGLLHTGAADPYQLVSYYMDQNTLFRTSASNQGLLSDNTDQASVLIQNLDSIRIMYLVSRNRWIDRWPQTGNPGDPADIPTAVKWEIRLADNDTLTWLFHVGTPR